ncbi:hypothetical protein BDW69DRAFT_163611 [Aspergillus filifer]
MHFSKIASVAVFAGLATASPIPSPQISVDQSQLQRFAETVQSFASSTGAGISEIQTQAGILQESFSGSASDVLQQQITALEAAGADIQQVAASLVEAVNSASGSFSETEQDLASLFSRRDDEWTKLSGSMGEWAKTSIQDKTNTGVEHQDMKNGGTSVDSIMGSDSNDQLVKEQDSQGEINAGTEKEAVTQTLASDYNVGVPVSGKEDVNAAASSQGEALSAGSSQSANLQGTASDAYNVGVPVSGTA